MHRESHRWRTRRSGGEEMTDIVLVRHGETVWHAENRYAGRSDVELNSRGRAQARALARWGAGASLDGLWCSELGRAKETAARCAVATGLELVVDARLNEIDFGQAEGLTARQMRQRFPREVAAFDSDPAGQPLPGGEDPRAAATRALECLAEIGDATPSGRVLVVTHNTLIRLVLCRLLGVPLAHYRARFPSINNCSLSEIRVVRGERAALLQLNAPLTDGKASTHETEDCLS